MAKAKGIDKATAYLHRIDCVEYDLYNMVKAYGADFLHDLVDQMDEIVTENKSAALNGVKPQRSRLDVRQDVQRWSAYHQLNADAEWASVKHHYFQDQSRFEPDID